MIFVDFGMVQATPRIFFHIFQYIDIFNEPWCYKYPESRPMFKLSPQPVLLLIQIKHLDRLKATID